MMGTNIVPVALVFAGIDDLGGSPTELGLVGVPSLRAVRRRETP